MNPTSTESELGLSTVRRPRDYAVDASRRSKMISLRISEEEYDSLQHYSREYGVRSISELARVALSRMMATGPTDGPTLQSKLDEFDGRLRRIEIFMQGILSQKL
jgi:hypothetical protein